eukprot:894098-Pyramimonas_sp.AAC.1
MQRSSGSRDEELQALALWCPQLCTDLALIFSHVEETGRWPKPLLQACVALATKGESIAEP